MPDSIHANWIAPEGKPRTTGRIHGPIQPRACTECGGEFIPTQTNQPTCRNPKCLRSRENRQDDERRALALRKGDV